MAILSFDDLIAAPKQMVKQWKSAARTTIASMWFSVFELAGNPGAGVLAGTDVAAGVVPTDVDAGVPLINDFAASAVGYISRVLASSSVASRLRIVDLLWKAGAYAYNAAQTLADQPSFSGRLPLVNGQPDYKGLEIWFECVTAFTGNQTVTVTYTNQDGVEGRSTGAVGIAAAPTLGRMFQLPLQAGDTGVRKIESVTGLVGSAGTFNILVVRHLWESKMVGVNYQTTHGPDMTGLVQVFDDSALMLMVAADSTSSGIPEVYMEIASA